MKEVKNYYFRSFVQEGRGVYLFEILHIFRSWVNQGVTCLWSEERSKKTQGYWWNGYGWFGCSYSLLQFFPWRLQNNVCIFLLNFYKKLPKKNLLWWSRTNRVSRRFEEKDDLFFATSTYWWKFNRFFKQINNGLQKRKKIRIHKITWELDPTRNLKLWRNKTICTSRYSQKLHWWKVEICIMQFVTKKKYFCEEILFLKWYLTNSKWR